MSPSSGSQGNDRRREFFCLCGPCSTTMKVTPRNGVPVVEQRFRQLISGDLLVQPDEQESYILDPI